MLHQSKLIIIHDLGFNLIVNLSLKMGVQPVIQITVVDNSEQ